MLKPHEIKGFSLIELIVVVSIMAILSAIAIPTFKNYQMKARESEARTNLAALRTCEESYKAGNDLYADCASSPQATPPGAVPIPWSVVDGGWGTDFNDIGFNPNGQVRYVYEVVGSGGVNFTATATGDLDDDSVLAIFRVTSAGGVSPNVEKTVADDIH